MRLNRSKMVVGIRPSCTYERQTWGLHKAEVEPSWWAWPTPVKHERTRQPSLTEGLTDAVKRPWPPVYFAAEDENIVSQSSTVRSFPRAGRTSEGTRRGTVKVPTSLRPTPIEGSLNPEWVELLLGFPPGWTSGVAGQHGGAKLNTRGSRKGK